MEMKGCFGHASISANIMKRCILSYFHYNQQYIMKERSYRKIKEKQETEGIRSEIQNNLIKQRELNRINQYTYCISSLGAMYITSNKSRKRKIVLLLPRRKQSLYLHKYFPSSYSSACSRTIFKKPSKQLRIPRILNYEYL